jgi:hypothetical protein
MGTLDHGELGIKNFLPGHVSSSLNSLPRVTTEHVQESIELEETKDAKYVMASLNISYQKIKEPMENTIAKAYVHARCARPLPVQSHCVSLECNPL